MGGRIAGEEIVLEAPWDGRELARVAVTPPAAVAAAVDRAAGAWPDWSARSFAERRSILEVFRDLARARSEDLARELAEEVGKPLWEARGELAAVSGKVDLSIAAWEERAGERERGPGRERHVPLGVCAVLGPFNFPAHLPNGQIVPALLAGNAVVFKPSEHAPRTGAALVGLLHEAGLPRELVQVVQGGRPVAEALIDHPRTAAVLFTGSRAAGAAIHQRLAGRPEVLLALEMGGNNPLILWDAADTEAAVRLVLQSAYLSAGQRCTCARRLIVPDDERGAALVAAVVAALPRITGGDPLAEPGPFHGPLVHREAAAAVLATQDELLAAGARSLAPVVRDDEHPALVRPGIVDTTGCAVPDAECFGPLLQVRRVADVDAAIAEANATRYGLAAALISDDDALWARCERELRVGILNRNRPTTGASGQLAFGGLGWSGNHRAAGYHAVDFTSDPVASLVEERLVRGDLPVGIAER